MSKKVRSNSVDTILTPKEGGGKNHSTSVKISKYPKTPSDFYSLTKGFVNKTYEIIKYGQVRSYGNNLLKLLQIALLLLIAFYLNK